MSNPKTLTDIFVEFTNEIQSNNLTYEDKCLELTATCMGSNYFIFVEFDDKNLETIQVYTKSENGHIKDILTVELINYLDDEDLCRGIPVELFISEMTKMDQVIFTSYGFDDL